jgi:bifunctional DNA-binding transcriptional regulator/antitoxin component of YhaV-PrlF toxin-antitoxin module
MLLKYEDLFSVDSDNNVILTIPAEILETSGWEQGDELTVEVINGSICLRKK